jgi:hypothetical protein
MKDDTISISSCPTCNHFPTQYIAQAKGNCTYRALQIDDRGRNFMRGVLIAMIISVPLWLIVAAVVYMVVKR